MAERTLAVVAHQDDDLIFLNPAIMHSIERGSPTLTCYLTAGEANGNDTNRETYAGQRRTGECAAYAAAAGVPDRWNRSTLTLAGRSVEISTLAGAPNVELVFLGLPDGGDSLQQPPTLATLWDNPAATAHTIVYPGSPVSQSLTYTRAQLLVALQDLMVAFAPTVVLVQDAEPDPLLFPDHTDHVAAARFAREATTAWAAAAGVAPILIEHRDYSCGDFAQNLTDDVADAKKALFQVYAAHDSLAGQLPFQWLPRHFPRWSPGSGWVGADGAGRLHVFSVQGGTVRTWRQSTAGAPYTGPSDIGGAGLAAALTVGANADGRVQVFGVDLATHDVVTAFQGSAGGGFGAWVSLGNPNGPGGQYTGAPAVGTNADGRLQVFAKNSGGGVSTAWQTAPNGGFSGWLDLGGGPDVQGAPVCRTRAGGRMALFASTRAGVRMWWQTAPNGGWAGPSLLASDPVTSSPTVTPNADGRLQVFWRGAKADVRTVFELAVDGAWSSVVSLGGQGGVGEIAAVTAPGAGGRVFLLTRNTGGGISTVSQTLPNDVFGGWIDLGGVSPGTPAAAVDPDGLPLAFHIATDGRLLVADDLTGPPVAVWARRTMARVGRAMRRRRPDPA